MKKRQLLTVLTLAGFVAITTVAYGQVDYTDPKVRNPQGDKDVERGWQKAQQELKEKKEEESRKAKNEITRPYEVDLGGVDDANAPFKK